MGILDAIRMKREHRWSKRHISPYLDGELGPEDRRRLERHAGECPECGPMLRSLTKLMARLRRMRAPGDPEVTAAVIERLRREGYGESPRPS